MVEEIIEGILFLAVISIAIISIIKIFKTFEKGSMLGDLARGYTIYILITILLEVFVFGIWQYNKIILGIALQPKLIIEASFLSLMLISYIVLYKETSRFKKKEEREFGAKISEQDLVKFGFVKMLG